jgi:hypothetical protein
VLFVLLVATIAVATPASLLAQSDPNEVPLGDVARNLRKKASSPVAPVIDDDNFKKVMEQAESRRPLGSTLKYLMTGESKEFQVSVPDATCSLSFSAKARSLLSNQYSQMDLPATDMLKLQGPATIEGDALLVSVYNGSDWHVSEIAVALTVIKKGKTSDTSLSSGAAPLAEVRPEKKPDTTVIYRIRAAAVPGEVTAFTAPLNLDLDGDEEWHWAIVQAKGYPPQNYSAATRTTGQSSAR